MLYAIVCMDESGGIGYNGDLLYYISEDMKRFKDLTNWNNVIMGRKTWDSLKTKPLSNRTNIIFSKKYFICLDILEANAKDVKTIHDITQELIDHYATSEDKYFVIGGSTMYKIFLPYCEKVYVTQVKNVNPEFPKADTYFPKDLLEQMFDMVSRTPDKTEPNFDWCFMTYCKKKKHEQKSDEDISLIFHNADKLIIKGLDMNKVSTLNDIHNKLSGNDIPSISSESTKTTHAYNDPVSGHDAVSNPSHYTSGSKYEVIDFIENLGLGFCLGNVVKYICRAGKKYQGDIKQELQDLKKAQWYLERRIEDRNLKLDGEHVSQDFNVSDFIKDQNVNYTRKEILRHIAIWSKHRDLNYELEFASTILNVEIHRFEEVVN